MCTRFAARVVRGVRQVPSPEWLQRRLSNCGVRPINAVVDVTNYVLLEIGQPLHAYDLAKVRGGRLVARRAVEGETLTTLDGEERRLDPRWRSSPTVMVLSGLPASWAAPTPKSETTPLTSCSRPLTSMR